MPTSTAPRITARVDDDTQALLKQATAVSGMSSINSFVLSAAIEKAKHIIEQDQRIVLSERDSKSMMAALDNTATVHPRLSCAFAEHHSK